MTLNIHPLISILMDRTIAIAIMRYDDDDDYDDYDYLCF
jgi:hypothetical protein